MGINGNKREFIENCGKPNGSSENGIQNIKKMRKKQEKKMKNHKRTKEKIVKNTFQYHDPFVNRNNRHTSGQKAQKAHEKHLFS